MGRRNELRRNTKRLNICDFCNGIITYFTIKGINLKVNLYLKKKKTRFISTIILQRVSLKGL